MITGHGLRPITNLTSNRSDRLPYCICQHKPHLVYPLGTPVVTLVEIICRPLLLRHTAFTRVRVTFPNTARHRVKTAVSDRITKFSEWHNLVHVYPTLIWYWFACACSAYLSSPCSTLSAIRELPKDQDLIHELDGLQHWRSMWVTVCRYSQ